MMTSLAAALPVVVVLEGGDGAAICASVGASEGTGGQAAGAGGRGFGLGGGDLWDSMWVGSRTGLRVRFGSGGINLGARRVPPCAG